MGTHPSARVTPDSVFRDLYVVLIADPFTVSTPFPLM